MTTTLRTRALAATLAAASAAGVRVINTLQELP